MQCIGSVSHADSAKAAFCWQISRTSCIQILTIHALFITVQGIAKRVLASRRVMFYCLQPRLLNPFSKDGRDRRGVEARGKIST